MCLRIIPTFFSISFTVSGFMWRSLIHLVLSFVQEDKNGLICILPNAYCQLNQHHLWKMLSFFHKWFWSLYQRSSSHRCVGSFLGLQFFSIDLSTCHYINTMQFLWLLLCSSALGQRWWFPLRSSFTVESSFSYPGFFCYGRWICKLLFLALWRIQLEFWWRLHWHCSLWRELLL